MVILSHALYLSNATNETVIAIKIHQPVGRETVWSCRYEIDWPEGARAFEAIGFDALQTLQMVGAEIYSSAYHREGRLRAYDNEKGYGFPVAASLRDLLVGVDKLAL
jgi:hypothetical protein